MSSILKEATITFHFSFFSNDNFLIGDIANERDFLRLHPPLRSSWHTKKKTTLVQEAPSPPLYASLALLKDVRTEERGRKGEARTQNL